jgi:hypothetical protein
MKRLDVGGRSVFGNPEFLSMASSTHFKCDACGFSLEIWDDGHPYIRGLTGRRHYFYHPANQKEVAQFVDAMLGHEGTASERRAYLAAHAGCEGEFLCMDCCKLSKIDEARDPKACRKCHRPDLIPAMELEGSPCPKCRKGLFQGTMGAIS